MAEAVKAAGMGPNIPFNGLPSPWKRDDAAWFEAHPQRAHRVRNRFPYERFKGEPSDLPNVVISKIIVRQIRAGLRVRAAFIVKECSEPDVVGLVLREMLDVAEREESVAPCAVRFNPKQRPAGQFPRNTGDDRANTNPLPARAVS